MTGTASGAFQPIQQPPLAEHRRPDSARRSYHAEKIARAVADEIAAGGSGETLSLLGPAEMRRRLNAHLEKRGLRPKELPSVRAYRRYFNGR
jgi:hypothetical protein